MQAMIDSSLREKTCILVPRTSCVLLETLGQVTGNNASSKEFLPYSRTGLSKHISFSLSEMCVTVRNLSFHVETVPKNVWLKPPPLKVWSLGVASPKSFLERCPGPAWTLNSMLFYPNPW